jgi:transposase
VSRVRTVLQQCPRHTRRAPFIAGGVGVKPLITRRGSEHGLVLGKERWAVERTFVWLHNLRRLRIRYERSAELHMVFMLLGCAVVCQRKLSGA